jgi:hypothetical protein
MVIFGPSMVHRKKEFFGSTAKSDSRSIEVGLACSLGLGGSGGEIWWAILGRVPPHRLTLV